MLACGRLVPHHVKRYRINRRPGTPRVLGAPGLQNVGRARYKCGARALTLTSFLFHFALFSDVLLSVHPAKCGNVGPLDLPGALFG